MDTTSPLSALSTKQGFVADASNCVLGLEGGYIKRDGYTTQLTWSTNLITAGLEFTGSSVSRQVLLFGTNNTTSGGILAWNNSGTPTTIQSNLSGTTRPSLISFRNLAMLFNGVDAPLVYDGASSRQLGITAPVSAPTLSSQTTGGALTLLGSYLAFYTYYNSVTGAESTPSPASASIVLTGGNNKIIWTVTPGVSTTADTLRLYRTVAFGNQAFLDGTTTIASTTYTSTIADSGLTTAMEIDNTTLSSLTTVAKYPQVCNNRVFVRSATNQVRWSKIGQSGAMPESFQVNAFVDTMGTAGNNDEIVGIGKAYGSFGYSTPTQFPIIMKKGSFGRLDTVNVPDPTNPSDGVFYTYQEISDKVGAVSHWAGVQVNHEWIFLSRDNIYATDGYQVRSIADAIQATIKSLSYTSGNTTQISAINDIKNQRVLFSVFTSGSTTPSTTLVGDYRKYPNFRWTWWNQGTSSVTWPSVQPACFFHVTDATDGSQDVWFGNTVSNGKVYLLGNGATSDDGSGIYFQIIDRPRTMQHPMNIKLFKDARIDLFGNGNVYNLSLSAIFDLSGQEVSATNINLATSGSTWDGSFWDTATFAFVSTLEQKYSVHQKAKFMQLVMRQTSASAPVTIYNWGVTASLVKVF